MQRRKKEERSQTPMVEKGRQGRRERSVNKKRDNNGKQGAKVKNVKGEGQERHREETTESLQFRDN
jgi:hypothetical protein